MSFSGVPLSRRSTTRPRIPVSCWRSWSSQTIFSPHRGERDGSLDLEILRHHGGLRCAPVRAAAKRRRAGLVSIAVRPPGADPGFLGSVPAALGCRPRPHRHPYTLTWAMMLSPDAGSGVGPRVSRWTAAGIPDVWRSCSLPSWGSSPNRGASLIGNQGANCGARWGRLLPRSWCNARVFHQDAALAICSNLRIFQHALCRL